LLEQFEVLGETFYLCLPIYCKNIITCWFEVLWASVKGPCLYRPENWLIRQLIDELKPEYKVGFIREKGKATTRTV
jgi:hypothetical protein